VSHLVNFPVLVFLVTLLILVLSVRAGERLVHTRIAVNRDSDKDDLNLVINASLTLLALIIGFSFSMAVSRYDLRKSYEEEEANAIGTEYVRADILPSADAAKVKQMLTRYLDQRILFYTVHDPDRLNAIDRETEGMQAEMWSSIQAAAAAKPTPTMALVVAGMNDVLNRQGYTQAAWWNRIPTGAWALMVALAICCCLLIGYGARQTGFFLFAVFPFLLAISFFLIADIDSPRRGVIRVIPHNLISLSQSLH